MNTKTDKTLRVEIVSDVVCPWCVIGYKQLERALARLQLTAEITWQPFELNPSMPAEGQNLREHLAGKYGTTLEGSIRARAMLTERGAALGFSFRYSDDMRMYNTFRAHQLLHWASERGEQHALKLELFAEYFSRGHDVSDIDVLTRAATAVGLDAAEARELLEDQRYAERVRAQQRVWTASGVRGVPAMVFQGKYLVTGAQGVENYEAILKQITEEAAA